MLEQVSGWIEFGAVGVELATAAVIGLAVSEALWRTAASLLRGNASSLARHEIRLNLGRWLALSLEFALAADILRTAVAPTWEDIGQLGAIAALRTALNYFLERELRHAESANAG